MFVFAIVVERDIAVSCGAGVAVNSFRGMALWGEPPIGALYWGGHNLVNFPSPAPPLRLCVCNYLALSNWRFTLCVKILYSFCLPPPNPTTK